MSTDPTVPLGIIAGRGDLPAWIIAACRERGRPYFVLAIENQTDPETVARDVPHAWIRLGGAGKGITLLRQAGVKDLVMAGGVTRPSLASLRPDMWSARFLAKVGLKSLGDDNLLRALIAEIEAEGFHMVGLDDLLPSLLAPRGRLGRLEPDEQARIDLRRGWEVARGLGALDVGQGVVVQQGIVLAVEAVEGTEAMLARAGRLARDGLGGVLVKLKKPQQERRADLPTIGPATMDQAAAAGLRGIAVEAGGTVMLDRDEILVRADRLGLFLIGLSEPRDI
ncbi:UDP-2,3-diacylglucosamine diphosphatase LpxI [Magnetospira thiophila]